MSPTSSPQSPSPHAVSVEAAPAAKGLGAKQKTSHRNLIALLPPAQSSQDRVDLAPRGRLVGRAPQVIIPAPSPPQRANSGSATPSNAFSQMHLTSSDIAGPLADCGTKLTLSQVMCIVRRDGAAHIERWAQPLGEQKQLSIDQLVPSALSDDVRAHLVARVTTGDSDKTAAEALVHCVPGVVNHFLARQFIVASTSLPVVRRLGIALPDCSSASIRLAGELMNYLSALKIIPANFHDASKTSLRLAMAAHISVDTFNALNEDERLHGDILFLQGLGRLFWHFIVTDPAIASGMQLQQRDEVSTDHLPETKRARKHI